MKDKVVVKTCAIAADDFVIGFKDVLSRKDIMEQYGQYIKNPMTIKTVISSKENDITLNDITYVVSSGNVSFYIADCEKRDISLVSNFIDTNFNIENYEEC